MPGRIEAIVRQLREMGTLAREPVGDRLAELAQQALVGHAVTPAAQIRVEIVPGVERGHAGGSPLRLSVLG